MKYKIRYSSVGKSYSNMARLNIKMKIGLKCNIVTLNPNRFKEDFENATKSKLNLELIDVDKCLYSASLVSSR